MNEQKKWEAQVFFLDGKMYQAGDTSPITEWTFGENYLRLGLEDGTQKFFQVGAIKSVSIRPKGE